MTSSQRLPRKEVVWGSVVTRSSSSAAGPSVSRSAGRILAAIPKSTNQTSPLRTAGIFILHLVKKTRAFDCGRIALPYLFVLKSKFQQLGLHLSPLGLRQTR